MSKKECVPFSIEDIVGDFANDIAKSEHISKRIDQVADLQGGFEGWLKIEFVSWAISKFGLNPLHWDDKYDDGIGVEESISLQESARRTKKVDIWLHAGSKGTHYIELKTVIVGYNESKQVGSWLGDFSYLNSMKSNQYPVGIASLLFAISRPNESWTDNVWRQTINAWLADSVNPNLECILHIASKRMAIAALVRQYE